MEILQFSTIEIILAYQIPNVPLQNSATSKTIYFQVFRTGTDSQKWNEE